MQLDRKMDWPDFLQKKLLLLSFVEECQHFLSDLIFAAIHYQQGSWILLFLIVLIEQEWPFD
ncbi:hypothetical protein SB8_14660 [Pseudomonas oryzihabitans]|nr:hypothetical protein SB8_14660 [Pseudomonas psychrotolerans]